MMRGPAIDAKTLAAAAELGVRLEIMNGLPIWEARPLYRHQKAVERIAQSVKRVDSKPGCECVHALDVYIQFPAGLKRPDISVFCREPTEAEQDSALTLVPEAVVEVVSKGFEAKDLELAPPFYLSQGVKDVVVFDPSTLLVLHVRSDGARRLTSPVRLSLECGCELEV
jgi:Uma2 family endonuclease